MWHIVRNDMQVLPWASPRQLPPWFILTYGHLSRSVGRDGHGRPVYFAPIAISPVNLWPYWAADTEIQSMSPVSAMQDTGCSTLFVKQYLTFFRMAISTGQKNVRERWPFFKMCSYFSCIQEHDLEICAIASRCPNNQLLAISKNFCYNVWVWE